ncbi:hypothetical protein HDV00_001794 [Rhizophlyctis rosea]|nr:hypothetical protein HDV00_001794 [Rhizophlyctis rosea]
MIRSFQLVSLVALLPSAFAGTPTRRQAGAAPTSNVPNATLCEQKNWNLGGAVDPNAPPQPWPVSGQQVYIQDDLNFCINLPNSDDPYLKYYYYSRGQAPTIVEAEGYVQSFCMGNYLAPGAKAMPVGGITAAHVEDHTNNPTGQKYIQITGRMNCTALNINCIGTAPGAYDDGGQFDDVPYNNCGKEPYSGPDASKMSNLNHYVEQAGDGIFCMRICDGDQQLGSPCNVKNDTAGCFATMNMVDRSGFSYFNAGTGQVRNDTPTTADTVSTTTTATTTSAMMTGSSTTASATASPTGTAQGAGSGAGMNVVVVGVVVGASAVLGLFMAL